MRHGDAPTRLPLPLGYCAARDGNTPSSPDLARLEKWSDASPSWTSCPWSTSVDNRPRRRSASRFPVRATVFREGHDQLGAEVVLTAPDGGRRPPVRMTKHETVPDRYDAWVTPDVERRLDLRDPRVVRPDRHLGARRRAQDPGRRRRRADVHRGPAPAARRCSPRSTRPAPRASVLQGAIEAAGDPGRPPAARLAVLQDPALVGGRWRRTRSASWSRSRAPTRRTPTGRARCSAAGTSSSRAPRAPPSTPTARSSAAPSRPPPSGSTPWPRWASTSSTCRRSTRSARSTARAPTTR